MNRPKLYATNLRSEATSSHVKETRRRQHMSLVTYWWDTTLCQPPAAYHLQWIIRCFRCRLAGMRPWRRRSKQSIRQTISDKILTALPCCAMIFSRNPSHSPLLPRCLSSLSNHSSQPSHFHQKSLSKSPACKCGQPFLSRPVEIENFYYKKIELRFSVFTWRRKGENSLKRPL